jgi:hypothetical protein
MMIIYIQIAQSHPSLASFDIEADLEIFVN